MITLNPPSLHNPIKLRKPMKRLVTFPPFLEVSSILTVHSVFMSQDKGRVLRLVYLIVDVIPVSGR